MTDSSGPPPPSNRDAFAIVAVFAVAAALNVLGFALAVAFPLAIGSFAAQADDAGTSFTARQVAGAVIVMAAPLLVLAAAGSLVRGLRRQLSAALRFR